MELNLRPMGKREQLYAYTQSQAISSRTGYLGYLRGDFGKSGEEYHPTFFEYDGSNDNEYFIMVFGELIDALQTDKSLYKPMSNRNNMRAFCSFQQKALMQGNYGEEYGFRVNVDDYAFLIRFEPYHLGDYDFYIFAYEKEHLDRHIQKAAKDIRFITPDYKTIFMLEDGDNIKIFHKDGSSVVRNCRFIDEYHTEIGNCIYHICEFAEICERADSIVIPYRQSLPEKAYTFDKENNEITEITKGNAFTEIMPSPSPFQVLNKAYTDDLNKDLRVSKKQLAAMIGGSTYGWDSKHADPRSYTDEGKLIQPKNRQWER